MNNIIITILISYIRRAVLINYIRSPVLMNNIRNTNLMNNISTTILATKANLVTADLDCLVDCLGDFFANIIRPVG